MKVRNTDSVRQAQLAGALVKIGKKVDPGLAQATFAQMYSMAVNQDQIPDTMLDEHCRAIQVGIKHLLELNAALQQ